MRIFVFLVGFAFLGSMVEAGSPTAQGFNSFGLQTSGAKHAHKRVRFSDGTKGDRFELRAGDCPKNGDCRTDRERVEFSEKSPGQLKGVNYWYSWEVYLPPEFPKTGPVDTKLAQFHQRGGSGPELLFQLTDRSYGIKMTDPVRWDNDPMRPLPDFVNEPIYPRNSMIGRWTKVTVNAKWSNSTDGYIRIWVNGAQKFSYSGRTTNDPNGVIYFKYGLYRSFVSKYGARQPPTLVAYYRNVKRGKTRNQVEQ